MSRTDRLLLFAPMGVLLATFGLSIADMVGSSLLEGGRAALADVLSDPAFGTVLFRTIWISVVTTLLCATLSYPLALFLAQSPNRNLWLIVVISPWLVSLVVRTFGWLVLLGNKGVLNVTLQQLGLITDPVRILFTPGAVVVGLVHVFLPFSVIATLSGLLQQDRTLEEAGQILGGSRWQVFSRVTWPLSLPGIIAGSSLVLLLSTGSIVTPLLLGGLRDRMLGTQIYTEIFQIFDFPRATAVATILLITSLVLVAPLRVMESRIRGRSGAAA